jgi:hypothetical protein
MIVTAAKAYIPPRNSLPRAIAADPAIGIAVSDDPAVPAALVQGAAIPAGGTARFLPLKPAAIGDGNYDKLIGKQITLADLGIDITQKGLDMAGVKLPDGANTAFEVAGLVVSTAATVHAFTREDSCAWDQAVCSLNTLSILGTLIAPAVPQLAQYQPALQFVSLMLKGVKTADEIVEIRIKPGAG